MNTRTPPSRTYMKTALITLGQALTVIVVHFGVIAALTYPFLEAAGYV